MATGLGRDVPPLYEEDDVLDERLLNQISKWIMYHRLPSLARHLGISDAEISRIMIPSTTLEEQIFQVCSKVAKTLSMYKTTKLIFLLLKVVFYKLVAIRHSFPHFGFNLKFIDSDEPILNGLKQAPSKLPATSKLGAKVKANDRHPIRLRELPANDTCHRCIFKALHSTVFLGLVELV